MSSNNQTSRNLFEWSDCDSSIVNLTERGLTPVLTLNAEQDTSQQIESVIPLLREKTLQWLLDWQSDRQTITTLFLKLATGNRINHCHLKLTITKTHLNQSIEVAKASLDGTTVQDNQWNSFELNQSLPPGKYLCQLTSPDADNAVNTLFIWLTTASTEVLLTENLFESIYYGLMPITSWSTKASPLRIIETSIPILRGGKTLQWPLNWQGQKPLTFLLLKLATGGRINHCQLVLTIWQEQPSTPSLLKSESSVKTREQPQRFFNKNLLATAKIDGTMVQDMAWTPFILDQPLLPGNYQCQLRSPNTDNGNNVIFIMMTTAYAELAQFNPPSRIIIEDLSSQGLMPLLRLSSQKNNLQPIMTSLPLLQQKIIQWNWQLPVKEGKILSLFLKLGTGGRINWCRVELHLFQEPIPGHQILVAKTYREGSTIRDNEWTPFIFNKPLLPGNYRCQLRSPNTNDTTDVLFLAITAASKQGLAHYQYSTPSRFTLTTQLAKLRQLPRFSIVILLFQSKPLNYLRACLNSVIEQAYPYWELYLIVPITNIYDSLIHEYEQRFTRQIHRISALYGKNAAQLYNQALNLLKGEYTLFLRAEDLLTPDALLEMAWWINQTISTPDMIYADEDKVNARGIFDDPHFKPNWSPQWLFQQNYVGAATAYRTNLLRQIGGFRESLYTQEMWDMTLRLTAKSQRIEHIPKILYHQRGETQISSPKTLTLKIIQEALNEEGEGGQIALHPTLANTTFPHYAVKGKPLVSIIIPTKDLAMMLARCIESLRRMTTYPYWEIIIVNNGSSQAATFELFEQYHAELKSAFTVISHDIPFNFAKLVNQGVKAAKGEIILLLNNDTAILTPSDWLEQMLGFAQHSKIGAVGGKLFYPDNTIQHAGLICGIGGIANHSHKHLAANEEGYYQRLALISHYSAVTGACLMVKRELWERVNGFDENLAIAFNDVDFCLKLLTAGFYHLVLPHVIFHHDESKTRGAEDTWMKKQRLLNEEKYMKQRWGQMLKHDPFYNRHLTPYSEDFQLSPHSIYYNNN